MMSTHKVVWSEGMFVRPQHFQQQDRYLESLISRFPHPYAQYCYGLYDFSINPDLLDQGKFGLLSARGVFPDGTPFIIPEHDKMPSPVHVPEDLKNKKIYLAIPNGAVDRYNKNVARISNAYDDMDEPADIELATLRVRFLFEDDDRSDYSCIAIAKIIEVRPDKKCRLDTQYIPALLNIKCVPRLSQFVEEMHGLLQHRADVLASRLTNAQQSESSVIADFMLLQLANKYEAKFLHESRRLEVHPESLYTLLISVMSEIATYTCDKRRPPVQVAYQHADLNVSFTAIMNELRQSLSMVLEQHAVAITLIQQNYGVYVAEINDTELLQSATMVLAIHADMPVDDLKSALVRQVKFSSVDKVRDLVSRGLPGVTLTPLAIAPRQIPYHANFAYFELEKKGAHWDDILKSGSMALHMGGQFSNLRMELWAIRG
jgi:type VI secretion system protein ImpJ